MNRADIETCQAFHVAELISVHPGYAVLQLGCGLICERKGNDVLWFDSVAGALHQDSDNSRGDDTGLSRTGARDDLQVLVGDFDRLLLGSGISHVSPTGCLNGSPSPFFRKSYRTKQQ